MLGLGCRVVSIPYRQTINQVYCTRQGIDNGVSIPYRQTINPIATLVATLLFSRFNSLQVDYKLKIHQLPIVTIATVSIPYRQTINPAPNQCHWFTSSLVSIPYRQTINQILLLLVLQYRYVSIPYRQTINFQPEGISFPSKLFQFLIGRL